MTPGEPNAQERRSDSRRLWVNASGGHMTLGNKQRLFAKLISEFLVWCYANDYEVTFGEATRPEWVAEIYAQQGKGIRNTLHAKRLALFGMFRPHAGDDLIDQVRFMADEGFQVLGEKWKS